MKKNNPRNVLLYVLVIVLSITIMPMTTFATKADETPEAHETLELTAKEKAEIEFKQEVLRLTNLEREKEGLEPLKGFLELDVLAGIRTQEIKVMFSHKRPSGAQWYTVFRNSSLRYRKAGENLGFGFKNPVGVVNAWMRSRGHRANILNPDFEYLGVGYLKDEKGRIHVSQLFFKPMNSIAFRAAFEADDLLQDVS